MGIHVPHPLDIAVYAATLNDTTQNTYLVCPWSLNEQKPLAAVSPEYVGTVMVTRLRCHMTVGAAKADLLGAVLSCLRLYELSDFTIRIADSVITLFPAPLMVEDVMPIAIHLCQYAHPQFVDGSISIGIGLQDLAAASIIDSVTRVYYASRMADDANSHITVFTCEAPTVPHVQRFILDDALRSSSLHEE